MDQSEFEQRAITLEGEDGQSHLCSMLGVFPFEGKEYALLAPSVEAPAGAASVGQPVLMRLVEQGDKAIFQRIDSDEEFERVTAFIKEMAREMDEETE